MQIYIENRVLRRYGLHCYFGVHSMYSGCRLNVQSVCIKCHGLEGDFEVASNCSNIKAAQVVTTRLIMGLYIEGHERSCCIVPVFTEFSLFEVDPETGEKRTISDTVSRRRGTQFGDDWVVLQNKAINKLLDEGASYSALRLYLKLVSMQDYGKEIRVSKPYLYKSLDMHRKSFADALKWLEDSGFVREIEVQGQLAFVLNPDHTAKGSSSLKARKSIWSLKAEDLKGVTFAGGVN